MKVAVIGAGRMGQRHCQVARSLGLTLLGVGDQARPALDSAAQVLQLHRDQLFEDVNALLDLRPECVIVATTAPAHAHYACLAAERGARFILCEKPLAASLRECDRIINACAEHSTFLAVNHQMRFMEQYLAPKQLLDSLAFGGLRSINVAAGNFGMAMNATHYFEMFRFMTGEAATEVVGWFCDEALANPRGPQFVDRAGCVRATTTSGKRFYLDCSSDQGHGMHVVYGARNGQVSVDELRGQLSWACRKAEHRELPTTRYGMPWDQGALAIAPADALTPTRAVLKALLSQNDYPTGQDGRLAVATLIAAYLSNENGHQPVALTDVESHAARVFPWA